MCKKRKNIFMTLGILMLTIVFVLAGCAQATNTPTQATDIPTEEEVVVEAPTEEKPEEVIHLALANHLTNETWHVAVDEIIAVWNEEHPNIIVEQASTSFDEMQARIAADRLADNPPDMYHLPAWWLGNLVEAGIPAVPPDDVVADVKANYPPGAIQAVTWDGQIWGMPQDNNPTIMIYNKAALEEAGYDRLPQTFEEMIEYARNLTKRDEEGNILQYGYSQWGSGDLNTEYLPFASQLYSCGGDIFDANTGLSAFNSEKAVYILEKWVELTQEGVFNPEITSEDWWSGRVAMTILPNWTRYYLTAYGDPSNFISGPVPPCEGYETGAIVYNWFAFVNSRSDHQAEAWDFLRWWLRTSEDGKSLSPHAQSQWDLASVFPARSKDFDILGDLLSSDIFPAFVDALDYAKAPSPYPAYEEIINIINAEMENAWFGLKTPQEALNDAAGEADALLSQ